jgi:CDP-glycerol glycerophosphotransferase (TagB/SpsB family)
MKLAPTAFQFAESCLSVCHRHRRHEHVQVKFKSDDPDSLVDLLVSDVLISNYSSLLNAFYYTRRPTVHIDPIDASAGEYVHRFLRGGKLRTARVREDPGQQWKLSPNEIGGLRASNFGELLAAVEQALADEHCCEQKSENFCRHYVKNADGQTCQRFRQLLENWP